MDAVAVLDEYAYGTKAIRSLVKIILCDMEIWANGRLAASHVKISEVSHIKCCKIQRIFGMVSCGNIEMFLDQ